MRLERRRGRHGPLAFRGTLEIAVVESDALRGNPARDPHERELPVYLPPGAESTRLPVLFLLAGFTGRGHGFLETHPWRRGVVLEYDRALARGEAAPALLVLPDALTRLGGSQYVNSEALGRYEDHLVHELVPLVDEHYPVLPGRRGVAGKSSGGFGALWLSMRHPGLFAACASISGDCAFELCYASEFPAALRGLVGHGMDPARFLAALGERRELSGDEHAVLSALAMAACYSPNPASPLGFDLPFDLETGERIESVWRRWLEFDPLVVAPRHAQGLRALEVLHLECGLQDEFHLQWGLRRLAACLAQLGVSFDHEEHAGGHRGIDHRWPPVLAKLARALSAAPRTP